MPNPLIDHGRIPPTLRDALDRYAKYGVPLGGCLQSVVCNDLVGAHNAADLETLAVMPAIVDYVYKTLPAACCGTGDAYQSWIVARKPDRDSYRAKQRAGEELRR